MAKSMPIDMRRVIRAAVDAALEEPVPQPRRKRRLSTGRALLIGAGLITAGKLAASSRGREVFGTLRDRVVEGVEDRLPGSDEDLPEDEEELDEQEELDAEEEEPQDEAVDDEFEGEEPGDWDDEATDEDTSEPELEEDEKPSRKAPTRRGRGRR